MKYTLFIRLECLFISHPGAGGGHGWDFAANATQLSAVGHKKANDD